jgi:hypothetical protein
MRVFRAGAGEVIGLRTVNAVDEGSAPPVQRSKPDQTVAGREVEIEPPAFCSAIETTVAATRLVLRLPAATREVCRTSKATSIHGEVAARHGITTMVSARHGCGRSTAEATR